MQPPDFDYLMRALNAHAEDQLTCQECQNRLPDYIVAVQNDQTDAACWRPVLLHLTTCPHCAAVYADLIALMALAEGEEGIPPDHVPIPDLTFLNPVRDMASSAPKPWHWNDLGHMVITFSADLIRMLHMSPPAPAGAGGMVKSNDPAVSLHPLTIADAGDDLYVTILVEQTKHQTNQVMLVVTVEIPSRGGWPNLRGSEVILHRGTHEPATQVTDAFGKTVFRGIGSDEVDQLVVEIKPVT